MQFRLAPRRRASSSQPNSGRRKKRMAVARLGGGGGGGEGKRGRRFLGVLRTRLRLRWPWPWPWLAAVYRRALRQLRASYQQTLRELAEGTVLVGALHAPAGVDCAQAASFGPMATVGF